MCTITHRETATYDLPLIVPCARQTRKGKQEKKSTFQFKVCCHLTQLVREKKKKAKRNKNSKIKGDVRSQKDRHQTSRS